MRKLTQAVVKKPASSIVRGISSQPGVQPDYHRAVKQHREYLQALKSCGLQITELKADEDFPDSVFVEDTAITAENLAVITRPGAESRRGEVTAIRSCLEDFYDNIESLNPPGTLDGGDILRIENTFYIGLSERTNSAGAEQLKKILADYGYSAVPLEIPEDMLHLKSGASCLGDKILLLSEKLAEVEEFQSFKQLIVPAGEEYAANSLRINDRILVPSGYPKTRKMIAELYQIITLEIDEFSKLDGGLSCLSLRF